MLNNVTIDQLSKILFEIDPLNFAIDPDKYYAFADFALSDFCQQNNIIDRVNAALKSLSFEDDSLTEFQSNELIKKIDNLK